MTDPAYMMGSVIVVSLWMSLGTSFLAFVAGLQGIDPSLYEAGTVDGVKNRWQELWFITLPSMKPQLLFSAVMSITAAFSVGEVSNNLCGNPSTDYAVHTMVNHIEDYGGCTVRNGIRLCSQHPPVPVNGRLQQGYPKAAEKGGNIV